jgi:hypothetical protein
MEVHVARSLKAGLSALAATLALLSALPASAEPAPPAQPASRTFALIVANNRSLSLALPDLQYADDDAARYYRLFRAAGDEASLQLLTTFDRASEKFYPSLSGVAKPATRAGLLRAVEKLRLAVNQARARGQRTLLYFVFAGHGEVAGGRGYLQLEDARIDGAFIEREIIAKIPAEEKHLLLDSCNSFFVINPRKPGGRRWATPKDMALGFSARHPEVGLFLSTNSDEEVFEWSELESGVFSHEVRSGLTGAADVNADGNVSYAELGGFVARANAGIPRDTLRPQVYYRGPRGNQHASLFASQKLAGRRLLLGAEQARVWIRGETGERLLDLHKEPGALSLTLPSGGDQPLSIFVQSSSARPNAPPTLVEHRVELGQEPIRVSELSGSAPVVAARGQQLFGSLFALPYGPDAYASFLKAARARPEPVYGVKDEDITRMGNYLTAMADVDRSQRNANAFAFMGLGALLVGVGGVGQLNEPRMPTEASIGFAAFGGVFAGTGLYLGLSDGAGEAALKAFQAELEAGRGNRALAFARTEQKLDELARAERTGRQVSFWTLQVIGAGLATVATVGLVADDDFSQPTVHAMLYGTAALTSGLGFFLLTMETPTERLLRLYRDDPGIKLRAGISPAPFGGASFGISGTF